MAAPEASGPQDTAGTVGLVHGVTREEFDQLASGFGGKDAVARLVGTQSSLQRELLAAVGRFGPQKDRRFASAWEILVSLDTSASTAVAEVLAHPYTRVWAVELLSGIQSGTPEAADIHHMEAIAASAALRAGAQLRLPVPVRGETAPLPTFGALRADRRDRVWIDTGSIEELDLSHPLRRLTAVDITVTLEDTDPYRSGHTNPAERQSDEDVIRWQREFSEGIDFIDGHLSGYAPGIRTGLRTLMPTRPNETSGSMRHAFGAIGVGRRDDVPSLALQLIHEFQHVKLGAILDMFDLYDRSDVEPRYYAPWRDDPRPLEGLLQGAYAHLGVTDFWRAHRLTVVGEQRAESEREFVRWRTMTAVAIQELLDSGSLTELGGTFARRMGETADSRLNDEVDPRAAAAAHRDAYEHRAAFDRRLADRRG